MGDVLGFAKKQILSLVPGAVSYYVHAGKVYFLDNEANAIAIMTFGAIFSLVILAVGIYAIAQIISVANLSADSALLPAMNAIPGGVVTIVGVVILAITISLIAVALAIFAQSMPGSLTGR
jgi:hypothetical protein